MENILLLQYNNYYNRIVKQEETLANYMDAATNYQNVANTNFNPNDGVDTEHLISWTNDWTPDYAIVYNSDGIISKWFVTEAVRTRGGQYKITLRRDVIVDNYDGIIDSPMYIEKAVCRGDDIAIYNKENIQLNQIKKSEEVLKDKTGHAYVVGYFAPNMTEDKDIEIIYNQNNYIQTSTIESLEFFNYLTTGYKHYRNINLTHHFTVGEQPVPGFVANYRYFNDYSYEFNNDIFRTKINFIQDYTPREEKITKIAAGLQACRAMETNAILGHTDVHTENIFNQYKDKYIFVTTGTETYPAGLYKVNYQIGSQKTMNWSGNQQDVTEVLLNAFTAQGLNPRYDSLAFLQYIETCKIYYRNITFEIVKVTTGDDIQTKISKDCMHLQDAPYNMFCIPVDDYEFGISLGAAISRELSTNLYDLQLLPYCPILDRYDENTKDFTRTTKGSDYEEITQRGEAIGYLYYCNKSRGSFDIPYEFLDPLELLDKKIANQCEFYRLCSPNYASVFEFNPIRTGYINKVNVDFTYKPHTPYIHINPNWKALYGEDFDDTRGLICQGDFSIPIINNKWEEYQINNKNYLNSFNRKIDSIELQNAYAKIGDVTGALAGTVSGAVTGGMVGGVAGAIAGGVASGAAGAADIAINQALRNEALDFTKDQFNMSLQNIQAIPDTLARVSSYDYNNKIFPVLEFYSCSDQEKEIFYKKLIYNGFTINRIDKISTFLNNDFWDNKMYVKGQIIRMEDVNDDTHMLNAIASELFKGVYL